MRTHDIESLLRSMAMAPLANDTIRDVLLDHRQLLAQRAELEVMLRRLAPAFRDLRGVLNELHQLLADTQVVQSEPGPPER